MKKYKLIKEYPGSPILNSEITFSSSDKRITIFSDDGGITLYKESIENNPEFWEKVVEKDYEILSFIATKKHGKEGYIIYIGKDIKKGKEQPWINNKSGFWDIHSVKRLSDDEVFTVDDTVTSIKANIINYLYLKFTIKNFNIINDKLVINLNVPNQIKFRNSILLKNLKHIKKPLITTADGHELYKGDEFFMIGNVPMGYYQGVVKDNNINLADPKYIYKYEVNAEEYVIKNKECLSYADILKLKEDLNFRVSKIFLDNILRLSRNKINKLKLKTTN